MPPPPSGSGAKRVHSTTLVKSGSPDAMPSVNGSPGRSIGGGVMVVAVGGLVVVVIVVVVVSADDGVVSTGGSPIVSTVSAPEAVGGDAPFSLSLHAETTTAIELTRNIRRESGATPASLAYSERDDRSTGSRRQGRPRRARSWREGRCAHPSRRWFRGHLHRSVPDAGQGGRSRHRRGRRCDRAFHAQRGAHDAGSVGRGASARARSRHPRGRRRHHPRPRHRSAHRTRHCRGAHTRRVRRRGRGGDAARDRLVSRRCSGVAPYAPSRMAEPLERLTNLLALLLETAQPLTLQQIANELGAQYPQKGAALRGAFERDKAVLRDVGVPIDQRVLSGNQAGQTAYSIDRRRYELAGLDLTDEERQALQLAVAAVRSDQAWGQEGLWKLGAGGAGRSSPVAATVPTLEVLPTLREAVARNATVEFAYRDTARSLDPYGLLLRDGYWYVIGHDRDRDEIRTYRVDRIEGAVKAGSPGAFQRAADFDIRDVFPSDPKLLGEPENEI